MKQTTLKYLTDILQAIEFIEDFTGSVSGFEEYNKDIKTQSAVERQLGIIGEAVNKFELAEPELSLNNARKIVGFRNRLIHGYDAVDPAIVWAIIINHLPSLKEEVFQMLR